MYRRWCGRVHRFDQRQECTRDHVPVVSGLLTLMAEERDNVLRKCKLTGSIDLSLECIRLLFYQCWPFMVGCYFPLLLTRVADWQSSVACHGGYWRYHCIRGSVSD